MKLFIALTLLLIHSTSAFADADSCEVRVSRNTVVADILITKGYRMPRNRLVNKSIKWALVPSDNRIEEVTKSGSRVLLYKFSSLEAIMTNAAEEVIWENSVPVDITILREPDTQSNTLTPAAAQEIEVSDKLAFQKINEALAQAFQTIPKCP